VNTVTQVCLLGFGEVGTVLAEELLERGQVRLRVWDRLLAEDRSAPARAFARLRAKPSAVGRLEAAVDAASAASDCELLISAVTAAQNLAATGSVLAGLPFGCWLLDLNSVAPATKQQVADLVGAHGGRYVEASVMSPIEPLRMAAPILLGGAAAADFLPLAHAIGFSGVKHYSELPGQAAATKMCRSVIVKGMEALVTEALLCARFYGVEEDVLASLDDLFPRPDWPEHARYLIARSLAHGGRRAEEMREVALTVADAGLQPWMSSACAERQAWAAQFSEALSEPELLAMLDAIRVRLPGL
jgi:3-hydroxyisobutyrate dehydrogenase-like beta-hydroxyacid dehydrogenase